MSSLFVKEGPGEIFSDLLLPQEAEQIPLVPPFSKGEFNSAYADSFVRSILDKSAFECMRLSRNS